MKLYRGTNNIKDGQVVLRTFEDYPRCRKYLSKDNPDNDNDLSINDEHDIKLFLVEVDQMDKLYWDHYNVYQDITFKKSLDFP